MTQAFDPQRFTVRHLSAYRYSEPVEFGEHRMMFRPRSSHDLRLVTTQLHITPTPAHLHWLHDVFDNSVAVATFADPASELVFESQVTLEHYEAPQPDYALERYATTYPFAYTNEEASDLVNARNRQHPDEDVSTWARQFLSSGDIDRHDGDAAGDDARHRQRLQICAPHGEGREPAGRHLAPQERQLPRLRGADDGRRALARPRGALRERLHLRARSFRDAGRRRDPRVAADLSCPARAGSISIRPTASSATAI